MRTLVERICAAMDGAQVRGEVVLVDDGSLDTSWQSIVDLASSDPRVRGLRLARNAGQHAALLAGIVHSHGHFVVTLDDDLQHPPESITSLLKPLAAGAELVYGVPVRRRHGLLRNLASRLGNALLRRATGRPYEISAYRAFVGTVRTDLTAYQGQVRSIDALLARAVDGVVTVPIEHQSAALPSRYSWAALLRYFGRVLIAFRPALPRQVARVCLALGVALLAALRGRRRVLAVPLVATVGWLLRPHGADLPYEVAETVGAL